jgi:hypothetical protein
MTFTIFNQVIIKTIFKNTKKKLPFFKAKINTLLISLKIYKL